MLERSRHAGAREAGSVRVAGGSVVVQDALGEGVAGPACFARYQTWRDAEKHGGGVVFEGPVFVQWGHGALLSMEISYQKASSVFGSANGLAGP